MNVSAIIKLTVSMAIFGSIGFFTIHTGVPALELVFIRCICATLFIGGVWLATGGHRTEKWAKKRGIAYVYLWRLYRLELGIFI